MDNNDGGGSKFSKENARKERAEFFKERINQYNDVARTAKEVGNHSWEDCGHVLGMRT